MSEYYSVSQYATITGKDSGNIRRMLIQGKLPGEKIGNQWVIPKDAEYPEDMRVKSGKYRNWRKISSMRHANPGLMKALHSMCDEINTIYGDSIDKIVLYGSYARGEQTDESDVDIAVILKDDDDKRHDMMTDVIVDYELDQNVTLSVITLDSAHYKQWKRLLPFYTNVEKEGIVLWKTV